ncbi:hypothetical protein QTP86_020115, partial [Hemibagrus guttatus]
MVVDFRRAFSSVTTASDHSPLFIPVEIVKSTKFLGVPWCAVSRIELHLVTQHHLHQQESPAAPLLPVEAEERPSTSPHSDHVLQRDHREHPDQLHHCLVWELHCLGSQDPAAEKIIGVSLPSITDMYTTRCIHKANSIVDDPTHPSHTLFTLLPSGKRYVIVY